MASPLADRIRPHTLDEVVGQEHLLGPGSVLRRVVQGGVIPNMIFYGPSGVGKTTVARIIAASAGKRLHRRPAGRGGGAGRVCRAGRGAPLPG